jgi:hypothetical protein
MTIRVAAIEVSHWHALHDAAYLRHLVAMPDVELVAIQDSDADLVARRAAEVGSPEQIFQSSHGKPEARFRNRAASVRRSLTAQLAHQSPGNGNRAARLCALLDCHHPALEQRGGG